jgi:Flp pilus assembly protein TadD
MLIPVPAAELLAIAQEYLESGRPEAAGRMARHLLAAAPDAPEALLLAGLAAFHAGRPEEAGDLVARAAPLAGTAAAWRSLAEIRRTQARLEEALGAARHALTLNPADPLALFQLALVLYDRQELPACLAAARAALELRPAMPEARMKLAQALLATGDFAAGWPEYEWRWRIQGAPAPLPETDRPMWNGAPIAAPLLLVADQGYGDAIMFARYLPWVLARAPGAVVAASAELHPLLRAIQPGLALVDRWEDVPGFAAWCPFSSLPLLHGTTLETIPAAIPYLRPDPARAAAWQARLAAALPEGHLRVGLAWAGRPTHPNDANRSTALATLAPLAALPNIAFVSLQKGPAAAEANHWPGPATLLALDAELHGFEDTAALLPALDLVLSVDTALVHLAGAMGRPCWVMLPFAPDWRWLAGRADSPWYPSLRLFRPTAPRAWPALVAQLAALLPGVTHSGGRLAPGP